MRQIYLFNSPTLPFMTSYCGFFVSEGTGVFATKHWQRISARMLKYYREMLTFLKVPGLPADNNHAERMIRPNVIFRKISLQNMSQNGAWAHEVLMSLL
jgi:hypothetical protein